MHWFTFSHCLWAQNQKAVYSRQWTLYTCLLYCHCTVCDSCDDLTRHTLPDLFFLHPQPVTRAHPLWTYPWRPSKHQSDIPYSDVLRAQSDLQIFDRMARWLLCNDPPTTFGIAKHRGRRFTFKHRLLKLDYLCIIRWSVLLFVYVHLSGWVFFPV